MAQPVACACAPTKALIRVDLAHTDAHRTTAWSTHDSVSDIKTGRMEYSRSTRGALFHVIAVRFVKHQQGRCSKRPVRRIVRG